MGIANDRKKKDYAYVSEEFYEVPEDVGYPVKDDVGDLLIAGGDLE